MSLKHRRASALTLPALHCESFCMRQRSGEGKWHSMRSNLAFLFSPYDQDPLEVHKHGDRHLLRENFIDKDIMPDSTSFYSSLKFSNLVANRQLTVNKLSFLHLNIRIIRNKFDALLNYFHLLTHKFSLIALTETWLNDMDGDNFKIRGYNITKVNRQNKGVGGICIL